MQPSTNESLLVGAIAMVSVLGVGILIVLMDKLRGEIVAGGGCKLLRWVLLWAAAATLVDKVLEMILINQTLTSWSELVVSIVTTFVALFLGISLVILVVGPILDRYHLS